MSHSPGPRLHTLAGASSSDPVRCAWVRPRAGELFLYSADPAPRGADLVAAWRRCRIGPFPILANLGPCNGFT